MEYPSHSPILASNRSSLLLGFFALVSATVAATAWMIFNVLPQIQLSHDGTALAAFQTERAIKSLYHQVDLAIADPLATETVDLLEAYDQAQHAINTLAASPQGDIDSEINTYNQAVDSLVVVMRAYRPDFQSDTNLVYNIVRLKEIRFALKQVLPQSEHIVNLATKASEKYIQNRNSLLIKQSLTALVLFIMVVLGLMWILHVAFQKLALQNKHNRELVILGEALNKAKSQAEKERENAENATKAKSLFLGTISHELRTPFQGLMGMLELLHDAQLSSNDSRLVKTAHSSAKHLLQLLNDLVDLSVIESQSLKLNLEPVQLPQLIESIVAVMRSTAEQKGLYMDLDMDEQVTPLVYADPKRLSQILYNLLNNAIKFTPKGGVTLKIQPSPSLKNGVQIQIQDTGIGMDEQTLANLFTRFYQADNSYRRKAGGAGIGLELSKSIAQAMGGNIQVTSEVGKGSCFTVDVVLNPATQPLQTPNAGAGPAEQELDAQPHFSLKLLIAEDNPVNRLYLDRVLSKMGHQIHFENNGLEALNRIKADNFDVVLLDYHMPELDGLETTAAIRALPGEKSSVTIMLITADVVSDTKERALKAGVNEVLTKPVMASQLSASLQRITLQNRAKMQTIQQQQS